MIYLRKPDAELSLNFFPIAHGFRLGCFKDEAQREESLGND